MANEPEGPARQGAHPHLRRTLLAVTASLSAIVTVIGGVAMAGYVWTTWQIRHIGGTPPPVVVSGTPAAAPTPDVGGPCSKHACNYLLLGSDSRAGLSKADQEHFGTPEAVTGQRSDTIIVLHVNTTTKHALFLSFPRDLWVEVPGAGPGRINSAFQGGINGGGAQLVARTIKSISGLQINHVLYANLAGFEGVVDALGGIDMCVPYPMQEQATGLDIQAGCQRFDGRTALAYVRSRHQPCDVVPDFARISRQQQFLRAVIAKLLSPGEIFRLPQLVPAVLRHIVVDQGLNPAELAYLAGQLEGVSTGSADFRVVPSVAASIYPNGVYTSIVRMVQPEADELFERIRENEPLGNLGLTQPQTPPSPAVTSVGVFDRNSLGVAATVHNTLTDGGFNTASGLLDVSALFGLKVRGSAILYNPRAPTAKAMADVVRGYLPNLPQVAAPRRLLGELDVAVVIGPNYTLPAPTTSPPVSCP